MEKDNEKFKFQIEMANLLKIISEEIYDSSYAMLRENVQNAYDAILMRKAIKPDYNGEDYINILIQNNTLIIEDNGIGMTEETLKNNYWKAGSSGKKTDLAKRAGVIGTFGIGAMANFGVCSKLKVETKYVDSKTTLISELYRDNISVSDDCIDFSRIDDLRVHGTKIIATLQDNMNISPEQAKSYLNQYVKYIPVKITINGELISQKDYKGSILSDLSSQNIYEEKSINKGYYYADLKVILEKSGNVYFEMNNIKIGNIEVSGEIVLKQGQEYVEGLRNYFGMAPIPLTLYYRFGGIVNLNILHPTAGREALSRESIQHVQMLVSMAEEYITNIIANTEFADKNNQFINYVYNYQRLDLAQNIYIDVKPDNESVKLGELTKYCKDKEVYYYANRDTSVINTFSSGDKRLLLVSQSHPKQKLQISYLNQLGIKEVPNEVLVLKEYENKELTTNEFGLVYQMEMVIKNDYLLTDIEIKFAEISHGVPFLVKRRDKSVCIYLARNSYNINHILECYKTDYAIFPSIVKDFVRINLYPSFAQYVPSSSKQGFDALRKILLSKREKFEIEYDEQGRLELELEFERYLKEDDRNLIAVINKATRIANTQKQYVSKEQVGNIEEVIPDITTSPIQDIQQNGETNFTGEHNAQSQEYGPMPPIMRTDINTNMKILATDNNFSQLNNFSMFICLSDRVTDSRLDFFLQPHSTKIIWGSHRIIYIFTHVSGDITMYYDIDLDKSIVNDSTGGSGYPTTTIITKNKIFVPVPLPLIPTFKINQGSKEFFVRFEEVL